MTSRSRFCRRRLPSAAAFFLLFVFLFGATAVPARAQSPATASGIVEGRVLDADGLAVPGIDVRLEGAALQPPRWTVSGADGTFRFEGVPAPGTYALGTPGGAGYQPERRPISLAASGAAVQIDLHLRLGFSEGVTVTGTREGQREHETAASVDAVTRDAIEAIKPTHPGQVMAQVPGVWVNTTGGEGHMTAIRQPLTTSPVYLFLEDGIPTRSTGFFNHNALYEVNVPAAEGVEVTKGPGSALYGSDAIGGIVNVLSRSALGPTGATADVEGGGNGWRRALVGGNLSSGLQGLRVDLNHTHSDGWRDATAYDRFGGMVRWDRVMNSGSSLKTLVGFSTIDQQAAGSSVLQEDDYRASPSRNLTPISYRAVQALRISSDYQRVSGPMLWNVIPYVRYNTMDLLPNWALTYDPTEYETANASFGLLAKVRRDFAPMRTQVVAGFDLDVSPGGRVEYQIVPSRSTTPNGKTIFSSYVQGPVIYDYDVTFLETSPYAQVDFSPASRLRVSLGARVDRMRYDYSDNLDTPPIARYQRPADTSRAYTHVSPKAGVTFQLHPEVSVFGAYRNAFRAPSEGQLFRQGSTLDTVDLKPVKAHNLEAGIRVGLGRRASAEASVYRLDKRDDILTYRDPVDGLSHVLNAGRTLHRGVELGGRVEPADWFQVSAAYTWARHTYADWVLDPRQAFGVDYSGHVMETAPAHMGNLLLTFLPRRRAGASLETTYLGRYWMDAANTETYPGHVLVNLRGQVSVHDRVQLFVRVLNLTDRLYAESSAYTRQRGREFAPGMPRTAYAGVSFGWQR